MIQPTDTKKWYCLRTGVKKERLAARHLATRFNMDVMSPSIRYERNTKQGRKWFSEAMFPGYIFAQFEMERDARTVQSVNGVTSIVHFGSYYPEIDQWFIDELKPVTDDNSNTITLHKEFVPGEEVELTAGPLQGMRAIVSYYMPASMRIRVLTDFLGRQTETEISAFDAEKTSDRFTNLRSFLSAGSASYDVLQKNN